MATVKEVRAVYPPTRLPDNINRSRRLRPIAPDGYIPNSVIRNCWQSQVSRMRPHPPEMPLPLFRDYSKRCGDKRKGSEEDGESGDVPFSQRKSYRKIKKDNLLSSGQQRIAPKIMEDSKHLTEPPMIQKVAFVGASSNMGEIEKEHEAKPPMFEEDASISALRKVKESKKEHEAKPPMFEEDASISALKKLKESEKEHEAKPPNLGLDKRHRNESPCSAPLLQVTERANDGESDWSRNADSTITVPRDLKKMEDSQNESSLKKLGGKETKQSQSQCRTYFPEIKPKVNGMTFTRKSGTSVAPFNLTSRYPISPLMYLYKRSKEESSHALLQTESRSSRRDNVVKPPIKV